MTKVSYEISVAGRKGVVKAESYPKAIETMNRLKENGNTVSLRTVYTPIIETPSVSKERLEKVRQHFAKKKLGNK